LKKKKKGRISLGNKAFYANQDLFKSKPLTKNSKLRIYKTLVRQTDRQTDRETDRLTERQTDRQTERQTDRQTSGNICL
jgi:hypothetical protein